MEGAFGVTIALIDIEPCETERRCSRSQVDSGGPAPVPEWEKVCSIVAWDALLRHCEITQARASTPIPLRSVRPSLTQEATTDATPPCCIPASTVMRARSRLRPSSHVSPPNPSAHSSTLYPPLQHPNRLSQVTRHSSMGSPSPHAAASGCLSTAPIACSLAFFHKRDATPFQSDVTGRQEAEVGRWHAIQKRGLQTGAVGG